MGVAHNDPFFVQIVPKKQFLMIICKVAFWQDNCPSERTFYKFSHQAGKIALFLQNIWVK